MKVLAIPGEISYGDTGILIQVEVAISDLTLQGLVDSADLTIPVTIPNDTLPSLYYRTIVKGIKTYFSGLGIYLLTKEISVIGWRELEYEDPHRGYEIYDEFLDSGTKRYGDYGWDRVTSGTVSWATLAQSDHLGGLSLFCDSNSSVNSIRLGAWKLHKVASCRFIIGTLFDTSYVTARVGFSHLTNWGRGIYMVADSYTSASAPQFQIRYWPPSAGSAVNTNTGILYSPDHFYEVTFESLDPGVAWEISVEDLTNGSVSAGHVIDISALANNDTSFLEAYLGRGAAGATRELVVDTMKMRLTGLER